MASIIFSVSALNAAVSVARALASTRAASALTMSTSILRFFVAGESVLDRRKPPMSEEMGIGATLDLDFPADAVPEEAPALPSPPSLDPPLPRGRAAGCVAVSDNLDFVGEH